MSSQSEVGLFVDFENIRYSMINLFGQEPDAQLLMEKARRYGPVAVAYAYADFNEHPAIFRRKLEVAGITARDVPRRSPDVAHKSSADMAMLIDIIDCLLDRPHVETLVLMTGDSDFIRAVARARHRFGKRVVISGVPGSVSSDLVESADLEDPILDPDTPRIGSKADQGDESRLLELVLWLAQHRPYMTFGFIRSHAMSPHHSLGMAEDRVTEILSDFKEQGVLAEGARPSNDGRTLRTLSLNRDNAFVSEMTARGPTRFEIAAQQSDGNVVGVAASTTAATSAADEVQTSPSDNSENVDDEGWPEDGPLFEGEGATSERSIED